MPRLETHMYRHHYQDVVGQFEAGGRRILDQVRNVTELLRIDPGDRVLEIGVGSGKFTSLVSRNNVVFGIDVSEESLDVARATIAGHGVPDNARLVASLCEKLPFRSERFEQVLCIDFIEHLTDESLDRMLEEIVRVLKPGGWISIYTPNRKHIFEYIRKPPPGHIGLRTLEEIHCKLIRYGFDVRLSYVRPSHFPLFRILERGMIHLPLLGIYFQKRICILATRAD